MLLTASAAAVLMLLQQAPAEGTDWDAEFGVEVKQRDPVTGELPVDPYEASNANAGASPFGGTGMRDAFHGQDGIRRVVNRMVDLAVADPRIAEVFVSHDLDVVRHISHRVAVMYKGEIVEQGPASQVTVNPTHPYTQRLLMASPVPDPDRQAERRKARKALQSASN